MYPHQEAASTNNSLVVLLHCVVQQHIHTVFIVVTHCLQNKISFQYAAINFQHNNNSNSFTKIHHDLGCDFEMDPDRRRSALNVDHPSPVRDRTPAANSIRVSFDLLVLPLLVCRRIKKVHFNQKFAKGY